MTTTTHDFDMQNFAEALTYATQLHANQPRKGTHQPFISHPLGVASIAMEYGASEVEAIAALLHDAAEDQGGERIVGEIRARFGDTVADIVDGCSDAYAEPGTEKPPWEERKAKYIAHLYHASNSVKLVSVADKLHNARTILAGYRALGDKVFDRFEGAGENKKQKTLWYYRKLSITYNQLLPGQLADELARTVATLVEVANAKNDQKATDEQTQVDRSMDDILARS